jgi:hypothetical protein
MEKHFTAEFCASMYSFYDRLLQQPNQSENCKAFRLERQQYFADCYCTLTSHMPPMPNIVQL